MEIVLKYFPGLSDDQKLQYQSLGEMYHQWNEKINVISRKDISQLYLRHVLHSLAIARYTHFSPGSLILDVGTGGGFPGIPLAIFFPKINFVLVDSIAKKISVVQAICNTLGLKNTEVFQSRAENVPGPFDFIVTRAVAPIPVLLNWVESKIIKDSRNSIPNGILALKGGDLSRELMIPNHTIIENISDYFDEPFFKTKKLVHVSV